MRLMRMGLVQAAEQLDRPSTLGDIGEHVGEADAVGIDDERDRAARRVAGRAAQQVGNLLHLLARQLRLGLGHVDDLGVRPHVGFDQLPFGGGNSSAVTWPRATITTKRWRTIKDATVKIYHYHDLESLKAHVLPSSPPTTSPSTSRK